MFGLTALACLLPAGWLGTIQVAHYLCQFPSRNMGRLGRRNTPHELQVGGQVVGMTPGARCA